MNKLFIVSTPIGNIGDISDRAKKILDESICILCEDTTHTSNLLKLIGVKNKLLSFHKFNESTRIDKVKELLKKGDVALVSDAGTPTISDPGQTLISNLIKNKVKIYSIPGPSAFVSAISVSGLKFDNFKFIGFYPRKENQIISLINNSFDSNLIVGYESPKRISRTLEILERFDNNLKIVVSREITKIHEETLIGFPSDFKDKKLKGEIVLIISNHKKKDDDLERKVEYLKKNGLSNKSIISYLTENDDFKKNDIYNLLK